MRTILGIVVGFALAYIYQVMVREPLQRGVRVDVPALIAIALGIGLVIAIAMAQISRRSGHAA